MSRQTPAQTSPVGNPSPPKRSRLKWWHWVLIGISIFFAVGAACGQSSGTVTPTATPKPQSTATLPPTANSNATATTYIADIVPRMGKLGAVFEQTSIDCSAEDIPACRNDMQTVHDEVAKFQTFLEQNPAPPCLQASDTQIHTALTYYHDAAALITKGIDNQNVSSDIEAGIQLLNRGNTALDDAATEMNRAQC